MKKLLIRAFSLILMLALILSAPIIAKAENINLGVEVTRGTDTITVKVDNSAETNSVLAEQMPSLTIPCEFRVAGVKYGDEDISSTQADGKISFSVTKGGTYTIYRNTSFCESEHQMGEWETVDMATCTEKGSERRTCGNCDYYETREVAVLEHSYDVVVTNPTYTEKGYTTHTCTCGDSYVDAYTDALGLPAPAVKVTADAQTGGGILTWEYAEGADYYEICYATSSKGTYSEFATATAGELTVNVPVGKTYYFKVRAIYEPDESLSSDYSAVVKVTGKCAQPEIDVDISAANGKPMVQWEKVDGAKNYEVYRATSVNGKYSKVKTVTGTSCTDTSAAAGTTYFYKVRAVASSSTYNSAYSEIKECLSICGQPAVTLKTDAATGKPILSWSKISGAVSYEISRADSADGEYDLLTEVNSKTVSYKDTSAEADKACWYKVRAIGKMEDYNSIEAEGELIYAAPARPNVTFAVDDVTGKAELSWEAVEGAAEYKIYRSTVATKNYEEVATTEELTYTDDAASAGKSYYYKVVAVGENSVSAESAYKKLSVKCEQPEIDVDISAANGKPEVKWEKVDGAKKYEVYRATSANGKYSKVKTVTGTSCTDTSAAAGTTYFYKVRAVASSSAYNSAYSEIKECLSICGQPAVTLKTDAATGKPILSWSKISGAVSYEISRADSADGEYDLLTEVNSKTVSYKDTSAEADKACWYKVRAIGKMEDYNSIEAEGKLIYAAPARPNVTFAVDDVTGKAVLSWEAVEGAAEYKVYRSTSATKNYEEVAATESCTYTDDIASAGKSYYYKVVAVGTNSVSAESAYKKLSVKCEQPEIDVDISAANGKPMVQWEKVDGAKKYEVYRATSANGKYSKVKTVTGTSCTDTSAAAGTTYFYKVRAVASSSTYNSAYSEIKECLSICGQPAVTLKTDAATGKPILSWSKVSGAVSYEISRADSADGEYDLLTEVNSKTVSYKDTSAEADKAYWYKVRAIGKMEDYNSIEAEGELIYAAPARPNVTFDVDEETGKAVLSWEVVEGAVEYKVYRSTVATKNYEEVATTEELTYTDDAASAGKSYYYKVVAVGENSVSADSAYKKLSIRCARPEIEADIDAKSGKIEVKWEKVDGAKKYEVYRATSENGRYSRIKTVTTTSCVDTGAAAGKTYYYKVKAIASSSTYNSVLSDAKACTIMEWSPPQM